MNTDIGSILNPNTSCTRNKKKITIRFHPSFLVYIDQKIISIIDFVIIFFLVVCLLLLLFCVKISREFYLDLL